VCPSEVSDIDASIYDAYADDGLVVWGVGPDDDAESLAAFAEYTGIDFPVLYDEGGVVWEEYAMDIAFENTVFPQEWLIDVDGRVAYVGNEYDPAALIPLIEEQLDRL